MLITVWILAINKWRVILFTRHKLSHCNLSSPWCKLRNILVLIEIDPVFYLLDWVFIDIVEKRAFRKYFKLIALMVWIRIPLVIYLFFQDTCLKHVTKSKINSPMRLFNFIFCIAPESIHYLIFIWRRLKLIYWWVYMWKPIWFWC